MQRMNASDAIGVPPKELPMVKGASRTRFILFLVSCGATRKKRVAHVTAPGRYMKNVLGNWKIASPSWLKLNQIPSLERLLRWIGRCTSSHRHPIPHDAHLKAFIIQLWWTQMYFITRHSSALETCRTLLLAREQSWRRQRRHNKELWSERRHIYRENETNGNFISTIN